MFVRRLAVLLTAVAGLLVACTSSSPQSTPPPATGVGTSSVSVAPSPTPGQPFASSAYHYSVASTDWRGTQATEPWNGTGVPGAGDPRVDVLDGPQGEEAYAYGEPTSKNLSQFVADLGAADAKAHPCSAQMPAPTASIVGGVPAALRQGHCPPPGGIFVVSATVVRGGRAYVFFTESIPAGTEGFTRHWFLALLHLIRVTN